MKDLNKKVKAARGILDSLTALTNPSDWAILANISDTLKKIETKDKADTTLVTAMHGMVKAINKQTEGAKKELDLLTTLGSIMMEIKDLLQEKK